MADILVIAPARYDVEYSIKVFERKRRNLSPTSDRLIHSEFTPLPANFEQFLSNPSNKTNFVKFLLNQMEIWFSADIRNLYWITRWKNTSYITNTENEEIVNLTSDHEEAGNRMFVYGHYIGKTYNHITRLIIKSPDTDVAIISCYHSCPKNVYRVMVL